MRYMVTSVKPLLRRTTILLNLNRTAILNSVCVGSTTIQLRALHTTLQCAYYPPCPPPPPPVPPPLAPPAPPDPPPPPTSPTPTFQFSRSPGIKGEDGTPQDRTVTFLSRIVALAWTDRSAPPSWSTAANQVSVLLFPNLSDVALHLEGRRADHLKEASSAGDESIRQIHPTSTAYTTTATEAVKSLVKVLEQSIFSLAKNNTLTGAPCCGERCVMHRCLLEQAFLYEYVLSGIIPSISAEPNSATRLPELWKDIYPVDFLSLPSEFQWDIRSCVRIILRSTAYSLHLALEHLSQEGEPVLMLECFMLWWWCNPDQVPVELPQGEDRLLPFSWHGACVSPDVHHPIPHLLKYLRHMSPRDRQAARSQGGFLCVEAVFTTGYRKRLRTKLLGVVAAKNYVSSALLFRILEEGLRLFWKQPTATLGASARGRHVIQQLLSEWLLPVLCVATDEEENREECSFGVEGLGEIAVPISAPSSVNLTCFSEQPTHWILSVACISASVYIHINDAEFRALWKEHEKQSLGSKSLEGVFEPLSKTFLHYMDMFFSPEDKNISFLNVCHNAMLSTLKGLGEGGAFHRVLSASPAWMCECWFSELVSRFPQVFIAESVVTTLWTLYLLEGMASSRRGGFPLQFAGQESAIETWRLNCVSSSSEEHLDEVTTTVISKRKRESVPTYHPYALCGSGVTPFSRRRVLSLAARDTTGTPTSADDASQNTLTHALPPLESLLTGAVPPMVPSTVTAASSAALERWCQSEKDGASSVDILGRVRRSALSIFYQFICLSLSENRVKVPGYARQPSAYVLLRLLHLLCFIGNVEHRSGIPPVEALEGDVLLSCIRHEVVPHSHGGLGGYLRRLQVLYLSHSGAYGAQGLLSVAELKSLLDYFTRNRVYRVLNTALIWSGIPCNAETKEVLLGGAPGSTLPASEWGFDGKSVINMAGSLSFGRGSLGWEFLASCLAPQMCPQNTTYLSFHLPMLREVLRHLVLLATSIPEETPYVGCLTTLQETVKSFYPAYSKHLRQQQYPEEEVRASKTEEEDRSSSLSLGEEDSPLYSFDDVGGMDWAIEEEANEMMEKVEREENEGSENPKCDVKEEYTAPKAKIVSEKEVNLTNEHEHYESGRASEENGERSGISEGADATISLASAVSSVPFPAQHLFLSLLDIIRYSTGSATGEDAHHGLIRFWTTLLLESHHANGSSTSNSPWEMWGTTFVISDVLQIMLNTCPDTMIMTCGVLLLRHRSEQRWKKAVQRETIGGKHPIHYALLPWYVECALCRLFYHYGLREGMVNQWLAEQTKSWSPDLSADAPRDAEAERSARLEFLLSSSVLSVAPNPDGSPGAREKKTVDLVSRFDARFLMLVSANVTLRSLHGRFSNDSGSNRWNSNNSRRLPFYVKQFAPSLKASLEAPDTPVLFPSLQLYGRHPSKPRYDSRALNYRLRLSRSVPEGLCATEVSPRKIREEKLSRVTSFYALMGRSTPE